MKLATTISEVIERLDEIIQWSKDNNSRMGYFASMYRRTTIAVQQNIVQNRFEDGKRMEQLDVVFANRYLQAWMNYTQGKPCGLAWNKTFETATSDNLIVLQHLLLGMNTHINFDLAIAAAQTCPGTAIYGLEKDFLSINDVIAATGRHLQDNLAKVWFPLKALQKISNHSEEAVFNFSIKSARQASWANGVALALVSGHAHDNYIAMLDNKVLQLADRIIHPGWTVNYILRPVKLMESKSVRSLIDMLES